MRPLRGVVIDVGVGMEIRLASRARLTIPRHPELRLGDTCYVLYDYTTMEVRDIWTEEEYFREDDLGEEPVVNLPPDYAAPEEWAVEAEGRPVVSL